MEITLAIIGTAGRKDDKKRLSSESFVSMCNIAKSLVSTLKKNNYPITHLVSGGSAWADHVAVSLYLKGIVKNLRLYVPCEFINSRFVDDNCGARNFYPPGKSLNEYHDFFQRKSGINSLSEITSAIARGAEVLVCNGGFHGRNSMVAKSDVMLAMTFGDKDMVKIGGGTADTVKKYFARVDSDGSFNKAFHYNLSDGIVYRLTSIPVSQV